MTSKTNRISRISTGQRKAPVATKKTARKIQSVSGIGGSAGFQGYLYQVEVSVWAALDLVIAKGMTSEVELEPCSHEDIEAVLEDTDPGKAVVRMQAGGRFLVIQAKLASKTEWSHSAITRLLAHGGAGRPSAKERLIQPNMEYVLVTSAPLTGVASALSAREFTQKMEPASMATSISKPLPPGAAGRVKVLHSFDEDRIVASLRALIVDVGNVPKDNRDACLDELRLAARSKMAGLAARKWTRSEIEEVIVRHEGFIATSPDVTRYVKPENWSAFYDMLQQEHAVVIYGRSGTGKTMTAAALWDQLHQSGVGYKKIVADSPSIVRATPLNQPVVFDVEDPWGLYRFEPGQEQWLDKLPDLLRTAGPNRKFIVTTREDVMNDAGVRDRIKRWRIALQPEHYNRKQKRQLFADRQVMVERGLQLVVAALSEHILGQLSTPNEIDRFFANLRDPADSDYTPRKQIERALESARYDSIELTIIQQVRARSAKHWAVVVWALLGARKKLTRQAFVDVHVLLADAHPDFETGLESFLNFFVSGHSLRQSGTLVSYYHPRAEAAFGAIVREEAVRSGRLLATLLDALTQVDSDGGWGAETAAHVLAFVSRSNAFEVRTRERSQSKIDDWIRHEIYCSEDEVFREEILRVAAASGSKDCLEAEFARFVLDVESVDRFPGKWSRPEPRELDSSWFERMHADEGVRALCCKWVEAALPFTSHHYTMRLAERLRRIEPGIATSFIRAADIVVDQGVNSNMDVVAAGAFFDLDGVENVVQKALKIWHAPSDWEQTYDKIQDGEFSEGYAQHLCESVGEESYSAGELLDAYVRALRQQRGWAAVANHSTAKSLGRWWARALLNNGEKVVASAGEVRSLVELAIGSEYEDLAWDVAEQAWNDDLLELLTQRFSQPIEDGSTRTGIARCAVLHGKDQFAEVAKSLPGSGRILTLLTLFEDLAGSHTSKKDQQHLASNISSLLQHLPKHVDELARPFLLSKKEWSWELSEPALRLIAHATWQTEAELQLKIRIALPAGVDLGRDVEQLVARATKNDAARLGIKAATHLQMHEFIEGTLSHPRGVVRAEALRYLAKHRVGVLPARLLALHTDKSRYVREAVLDVLSEDPRPEYALQLDALADDSWSDQDIQVGHNGDNDRRPIARKAAAALASAGAMDDDTARRLFKVAAESRDAEHRELVLRAIARQSNSGIQRRLFKHALGTERVAMARAIAGALLSAADTLDSNLFSTMDAAHILRVEPSMAAYLVVLLAVIGPVTIIDKAIGVLAVSRHRKVLLVLLAKAAQETFPEAAAQVISQLPSGHRVCEYLSQSNHFPPGSLDDLGDALTVQEVESWLAVMDRS